MGVTHRMQWKAAIVSWGSWGFTNYPMVGTVSWYSGWSSASVLSHYLGWFPHSIRPLNTL